MSKSPNGGSPVRCHAAAIRYFAIACLALAVSSAVDMIYSKKLYTSLAAAGAFIAISSKNFCANVQSISSPYFLTTFRVSMIVVKALCVYLLAVCFSVYAALFLNMLRIFRTPSMSLLCESLTVLFVVGLEVGVADVGGFRIDLALQPLCFELQLYDLQLLLEAWIFIRAQLVSLFCHRKKAGIGISNPLLNVRIGIGRRHFAEQLFKICAAHLGAARLGELRLFSGFGQTRRRSVAQSFNGDHGGGWRNDRFRRAVGGLCLRSIGGL